MSFSRKVAPNDRVTKDTNSLQWNVYKTQEITVQMLNKIHLKRQQ